MEASAICCMLIAMHSHQFLRFESLKRIHYTKPVISLCFGEKAEIIEKNQNTITDEDPKRIS